MKLTFDCLKGSYLEGVGHAADMIWIALVPSNSIAPASVDFHIQCDTSILLDSKYITGTQDLRRVDGSFSQFEECIRELFQKDTVFRVENAYSDENLNVSLQFNNGLLIKATADLSSGPDEEQWRILIHNSGTDFPHIVAVDKQIEIG